MAELLGKIAKPSLPLILGFNGGYVDTAGYLALQGLFTAHVTGNFVTLGAAVVLGTAGVAAKLLALPVFCAVIILARLAGHGLTARGRAALPTMLTAEILLLIVGGAAAILHGPFTDGDAWPAIGTGMIFVAAMAIQNGAHRVHLGSAPPSTLMTGTTTQLMIDVADAIHGLSPESRPAVRARMRAMTLAIIIFAAGAAGAAWLFAVVGPWCFALPPLVALLARAVTPAAPVTPNEPAAASAPATPVTPVTPVSPHA